MDVSEQELRAMVREAIARHPHRTAPSAPQLPAFGAHPSHSLLPLVAGGDLEGHCLIEPAVRCSRCGFCQSLGH